MPRCTWLCDQDLDAIPGEWAPAEEARSTPVPWRGRSFTAIRIRCRDGWRPRKPENPPLVTDETCIMRDMTPEEAERMLTEWVAVTRDRDNRVRAAVAAGISKHRVHQLTGIGRSTIDRILASTPAASHAGKRGGA
jgi:hypothetical protein